MSNTLAARTVATIIPSLRYRDAHAAIEWLCRAFGFEKHAVYADGDVVHHAQLVFGNGMIMLGSVANDSAFGKRIAQPDDIGGRETQCAYIIVDDYEEKDYGSAGYSCRDIEGHLWSFGSYDPWAAQPT